MLSPVLQGKFVSAMGKRFHGPTGPTAMIARSAQETKPSLKSFPTGVMAGDAEPDAQKPDQCQAVLWTKYTGKKDLYVHVLPVRHRKAGSAVEIKNAKPRKFKVKDKDGFVHFTARDLDPETQYMYWFREKGQGGQSDHGHFWTPLAPDSLKPIVFGGTCCMFSHARDPRMKLTNRTLKHAANNYGDELDFFLQAGDQLYCDAPKTNPAITRKDFRGKYRKAFSQPGLKAVHKAFGMYSTWDDHEVFNGWQGDIVALKKKDLKAERHKKDAWKKVNGVVWKQSAAQIKKTVRAGMASFYEHQPIRKKSRDPRKGKPQLWRSFRWGKTLEVFILDCRSERSVADGRYISLKQEKELKSYISGSQAKFKFILNSRPIGFQLKAKPKKVPDPQKAKDPIEDYTWTNRQVLHQRERVLNAMGKEPGVWWLSGDVHFGTIGWVDRHPRKNSNVHLGEVLMGPGGNWSAAPKKKATKKDPKTWRSQQKKMDKIRAKDHMTFATLDTNYVVFKVHPKGQSGEPEIEIHVHHFKRNKNTGKKILKGHWKHYWERRDHNGKLLHSSNPEP